MVKMKYTGGLMIFLLLMLLAEPLSAQNNQKKDIWYVWIDTTVDIEGEQTRLVSEEPLKITCCVKSGKFRRFNKKAARWIQKNYDGTFEDEEVFKKLQDKGMAEEFISRATITDSEGQPVKLVAYRDECR